MVLITSYGEKVSLLRNLVFYRTAFRNWWFSIIKRILNIYPIFVILNNFNITVKINNERQFYLAGYFGNHFLSSKTQFNFQWNEENNEMNVLYNKKEIIIRHIFEDGDFAGVFITEEYKEIDVNNRLVIDIGASICDTPLYFILKGANKIIAYEPVPEVFKMGLDNIVLNNLHDIIDYRNEAVGDTCKLVNIDDYSELIAGGSALRLNSNGTEIRQVTLTSVLDSIEFKRQGAILKLDCEGCEYALFSEVDSNLLKKLETIVLEYHNGLQRIPNILKDHGFISQKIKPKTKEVGLLIASRETLQP